MGKVDFDKFLIDYANSGFLKKRMVVNYLLEEQGLQIVKNEIVPIKDNKEPKFKVGDWVVCETAPIYTVFKIGDVFQISNDKILKTLLRYKDCFRLWDIAKDAKAGDVLYRENGWTGIFKALDNHTNTFSSYCFMDTYKWFCNTGCASHTLDKTFINFYNAEIHPATKEQRDLLFQKMREAGYEWDAEKKKLEKIEQKPVEKTDVLMSLDEAIEHCKEKSCDNNACALEHKQLEIWLTELKELKEQKQEWSEEDNLKMATLIHVITNQKGSTIFEGLLPEELVSWIKSLKEKVQPKVELTQLDKNILEAAIAFVEQNNHFNCWRGVDKHTVLSALHSLKPQTAWRPSYEQMKALDIAIRCGIQLGTWEEDALESLKENLEMLT